MKYPTDTLLRTRTGRVGRAWRISAVTDGATRRLGYRLPDVAVIKVRVTPFGLFVYSLHDGGGSVRQVTCGALAVKVRARSTGVTPLESFVSSFHH